MTVKSIEHTKKKRVFIPSRNAAGLEAAALAKIRKVELITGDPEFKLVENEIKIGWLK